MKLAHGFFSCVNSQQLGVKETHTPLQNVALAEIRECYITTTL